MVCELRCLSLIHIDVYKRQEYQRELERFLESDPEMFTLEAEIHHYIEILEPVLRDDGQQMWQALDRIISCVTFGKSAEFAQKYLHKGMRICLLYTSRCV